MKTNDKPIEKWYSNGKMISNSIIITILAIVLSSQSFANNQLSLELIVSVINHNSIYFLVLIYFILIQFSIGKKYFNYLNVFLVFVYFFGMTTSVLTLVQSFSLDTVLDFVLNFLFIIYLVHTLFRDSRIWSEFQLSYSPFNELTNEWMYNAIIIISVLSLAVNLISTIVLSGVILSFLDFVYLVLFGRFIYLYREYLDQKKLDSNTKGNFNEVRDKVQEVLDKTDIDDKIVEGVREVKDKIIDTSEDVKKQVQSKTRKSTKKGDK